MKKILLTLSAIVAILFAASCQRIENPSAPGAESKVTFSVQGPELMTRALGDGTTADQLTIAVYDGNGNYLEDLTQEVTMESKHANIELTLVNGMDYKIVFWAQANGAPYTFDKENKVLTVDYQNATANDENRDAFYHAMEYKADGPKTEVVTLKRPFAQLNIATSDWEDALKSGLNLTQTKITVSSVNTQMNMLTGELVPQATQTDVEFKLYAIPAETLTGYDAYKWLSVNYLLVNDKEVVDITFETNAAVVSPKPFTSVPVQRNYRTIIYGQILTSDINFNIDTDPGFNTPDLTVDGRVYKQVADIAAANALLAVDNSSVYAIAITSITANGTITLPATNTNDVHIILPATDKNVTIEGNATKYLYVEIPNGTVNNLTLNVPNTTAHVNGNLVNVAASTASNTLYITGGKIENLTVNQGNVVVEKGAELTKINNQANETITVTLADGVTEPTKDQNSQDITTETIKQEVTTLEELKIALGKLTTVTLGADITVSDKITINRDLVLDGNGHTLTSNVADANKTSHRAINVSGASDVTIKNLTINTNGERAINIIQSTKKVTVENVIATSDNYTVNIASSAEGATLVINNSDLTGKNTINMGGSYNTVTINNTKLTTIDDKENEGFRSVSIGAYDTEKDCITKGCKVVMNGGEINITGEHSSDSREVSYVTAHNSFSYNGTKATDGEMNVINGVAVIDYGNYYYTFKTLQEAVDKANTGETIILVDDVTLTETININKSLTIKLNGQKLTANVKRGRAFDIVADDVNFTLDATNSQVEFGNGTYGIIQLVADTDNATVTVNGGTFEGTTDAGALIRYRSGNYNTVNLINVNYTENCEIKGQGTSNPYVVNNDGLIIGTGCRLNITGGKYNVGCMVAVADVVATIENVTVIARGLTFELTNGTITNSDITLSPGAYVYSVEGAGILASNQGTVTITDTKITSSLKGLVVAPTGGEIVARNITLTAQTENDRYYIYDQSEGKTGKITVDGTVVAEK
jgi:hypothetical protein